MRGPLGWPKKHKLINLPRIGYLQPLHEMQIPIDNSIDFIKIILRYS